MRYDRCVVCSKFSCVDVAGLLLTSVWRAYVAYSY